MKRMRACGDVRRHQKKVEIKQETAGPTDWKSSAFAASADDDLTEREKGDVYFGRE